MLDMPFGDNSKVSGCKFPQGGDETKCDGVALGSNSSAKKLEEAKFAAERKAQVQAEKKAKETLAAEKKAQSKAEKAKLAAQKFAQDQEKLAQLELKKAEKAKADQLAKLKADLAEQEHKTSEAKAKEDSQVKNEFEDVVYAKLKKWAAYLDQQRYIYALYGALDGLNISYSTIKLVTDYLNIGYSSDIIHDWTFADEGLATAALGSISLIVLAMMANYLQEDSYDLCWMSEKSELEKNKIYVEFGADNTLNYYVLDALGNRQTSLIFLNRLGLKNSKEHPLSLADIRSQMPEILRIVTTNGHIKQPNLFKKYLLLVWPYCRDVFKGMKNSYKGLRSLINMTDLLGGQNLSFMLVPFALCLGALAVCNRLWYRQMKERRKAADDENKLIRKEILAKKSMTEEEANRFRGRIQQAQGRAERNKGMVSAFYTGFVEGLYLYLGVFALAPLTGPFFAAICVLSLTYVLASIPARMYEEYFYQRKLDISVAEVELALSIKVLKTKIERIQEYTKRDKENPLTAEEQQELENCIENTKLKGAARTQFFKNRNKLEKLSKLSDTRALLSGLRDGLTAYGVVASFLFAIATVMLLASVAFPPALLVAGVVLGMVCLIGFTVHSLWIHRKHREAKPLAESVKAMDIFLNKTANLYKAVKAAEREEVVHQAQPEQSIQESFEEKGLTVDSSPQNFFQEWFEILRSFLSGLGKGSKSTDFTLNHMQKVGADGHWHSTLTMVLIGIGIQLVYVVGLAFRAFARGFANAKLKQKEATTPTPSTSEQSSPDASVPATPPPSTPISTTAPAIPEVTSHTSAAVPETQTATIVMTEIGELEFQHVAAALTPVVVASVENAPNSESPARLETAASVGKSRVGTARDAFFTRGSSRKGTPTSAPQALEKEKPTSNAVLQAEAPGVISVPSSKAANQENVFCAGLSSCSI